MVSITEIISINKKHGGTLINKSNLDFAVQLANREKNIYRSNAHLIRGIINGHPFLDGNKRTAAEITLKRFSREKIKCDENKFANGIVNIAKKNINSINQIERRLRRWFIKK